MIINGSLSELKETSFHSEGAKVYGFRAFLRMNSDAFETGEDKIKKYFYHIGNLNSKIWNLSFVN